MAGISRASTLAAIALLGLAGLCTGEVSLATLEQAGSRTGRDAVPVFEGHEIAVAGQVSVKPQWTGEYYLLPIQDATHHGLMLRGPVGQFALFSPGDWIQARGTISHYAGLVVLLPHEIQQISGGPPPKPKPVTVGELNSFRYLGTLVSMQGEVLGRYEKAGRDTLLVRENTHTIDVVLGPETHDSGPNEAAKPGTHVRVTGIASQFCPQPPFDHSFQLLVPEGTQVGPLKGLIPPAIWEPLLWACLAVAAFGSWLLRERYLAGRRSVSSLFNQVSEEIMGVTSAPDIVPKISSLLPKIANGLIASLYVYNRGLKVLELISAGQDLSTPTISPDGPVGALAAGVALCFRNRTLLNVPDTLRSPIFNEDEKKHLPRSVMFVPMFAQLELIGVMQVTRYRKTHNFKPEDQAMLQHLANQAATAIQLQQRKLARERLFQTEKLAAAGQLLSGIASELRSPLGSILECTGALKTRKAGEREVELIEAEALRASEIVSRLVAFGKMERTDAQPVDVQGMLLRIIRLPALARTPGGEPKPKLLNFRVMVMGSQAQLEQVFLNLVAYASQASSGEAPVDLTTGLIGGRILIEIGYRPVQADLRMSDPFETGGGKSASLGLGLCRGFIQSHGGDVRFVRVSLNECRFEIELPIIDSQQFRLGASTNDVETKRRQLTALIVEPDLRSQKQLLEILTNRGDRVVPIHTGEEAAELVLRLRFDVILCSARLPGLNWVDFFEKVRRHVGSFILLTHGHDHDLSKAFQNGEGFVLSKPLDERVLNRICDAIAEGPPPSEERDHT